ncbi:hypothetical protein CEXT_439041 [Caerostris extrusa]|uniref:Granulins domain-containing protein n=1 Tax=Caerostris extrusa TaxID=172846 RepID=A0AAV4NW43_CAEEX|nr:hypothetical protein CEXT_439041 [Caerostris extrusa]
MDKTATFRNNHIACTYVLGTRHRKPTRHPDKNSRSAYSLFVSDDVFGTRCVPLPEYRVLSQKLNETGIEMCEDMLHLCPATADCCKKEDGRWDCCPKQDAIGGTVMFFENRLLHPGIQKSLLHRQCSQMHMDWLLFRMSAPSVCSATMTEAPLPSVNV